MCSGLKIVTGIQGANNTLTIRNIRGTGQPQWVSFWYINQDDMGYGDQPGMYTPSFPLRSITDSLGCY